MRQVFLWICLALSLTFALPGAAPAQGTDEAAAASVPEQIDYEAWEAEATRAEDLIDAGAASTTFFEGLRQSLVEWRGRFVAAQDINASRIETLQSQIAALGAAPAADAGETEPAEISERRRVLNEQLAVARVPRVNAAAALTRADGLIEEIDGILRDRQTEALLELDPSPLNPVNWSIALTAAADVATMLETEVARRFADPMTLNDARENAPLILGLFLVGFLALIRGRVWASRWTEHLQVKSELRGRGAVAFLVSLLQMALPVAGIVMMLSAVVLSGLTSGPVTDILQSVVSLIIAVVYALWIAGRLFPRRDGPLGVLSFTDAQKTTARRQILLIGLLCGVAVIAQTLSGLPEVPPAARGVMTLPIYVAMGWTFWRVSRVLGAGEPVETADEGTGFARSMMSIVGKGIMVIAVLGPVLGAIGYTNASEAIMLPTAQTLALLALLVALQPVINDLYALVFRTTHEAAGAALLPILVNFIVAFAVLPLIALSWGMRPEQLSDLYSRFWEGVSLGGVRITPGTVFAVVILFAVGIVATRLVQGALRTTVLPRTRMDLGARNALTAGVGYIGIALAAVVAVTAAGIDMTALGFVLGALSVGIGFGLQNVVSNFVSGIILLIERPISEGDWIEVNGNMGIVKDISVRSTVIETFDKTDVIVPNADFISGTVTNWTRGNNIGRAVVLVGVAYGTDTRRVQDILMEIARGHPDVASFPEPGVDFLGFGADSLDFRVRAILRDVNKLVAVKTELNHQIAERFAEEGIEIPFAQRDIWLRNPETLREAVNGAPIAGTAPVTEAKDPEPEK